MVLAPAAAEKISKIVPRLASNHDGEVVATVKAIIRVLEASGSSLHDLAEALVIRRETPQPKPQPSPSPKPEPDLRDREYVLRVVTKILRDKNYDIQANEDSFLSSVRLLAANERAEFRISSKQEKWLGDILRRCGFT